MAILSFQKDAPGRAGIVHGKYDDRAAVMNHIASRTHTVGLLDVVGADRKHRAAVHGAGGDEVGLGAFAAGWFRGCFGHGNNITASGTRRPAFGRWSAKA